ncbi:MAG: ABC transporter permease subunit [Caldilineaceae bacterium]
MAVQALPQQVGSTPSATLSRVLWRMILLLALDGFVIWFATRAFGEGFFSLGLVTILIAAAANYIILVRDLYPLQWMLLGLVFMTMFSIYPIVLTIFVAFTNYGDGHLLTKPQSVEQITKERFVPEGGSAYSWTGYIDDNGNYALWLQDASGNSYFAVPGEPLLAGSEVAGATGLGDDGIPEEIEGYQRLNAIQVATDKNIQSIQFGSEADGVQIRSAREAAQLQPKFVYDEAADRLLDQSTGTEYLPIEGRWTAADGSELTAGFRENVGLANFTRFFQSPAFRGPLTRIIIWNFAFAFLSVFMTFALGLAIAYIFNDPGMPGRKLIQSFLLIPYTIPSLITILIWRGMFNNQVGIINRTLMELFGIAPSWTVDPWLAKLAILIVNLWLGYPYFMLICSGALQSIPKDLYEAATVDGANAWVRFRKITLPLLLVAVGPLLVASFTYNFNNFNIIFLFIEGGPPIAGSPTRAGHTDILISYVYNLAFAAGRGKEFGLGAAITIVIFAIVAVITLFQFRFTKMWEEVGENV